MSRKTFIQEMQEVKNDVLLLGSMVENAVMESVQALKDNDLDHSSVRFFSMTLLSTESATTMKIFLWQMRSYFRWMRIDVEDCRD